MSRSSRPGPTGRPATAEISADSPGSASPSGGRASSVGATIGLVPSGQGAETFSQVDSQASEISATEGTPKKWPTGA